MRPVARCAWPVLLFLLSPAFLSPHLAHAARAREANVVMGTVLQVTVVADDEANARALAERVVSVARHWDGVLTTWREDGELAELNARAGRGTVPISNDLRHALASMLALARVTGGAFDPAVGPLVDSWRDDSGGAQEAPRPIARHIVDVLEIGPEGAVLSAGAALDAGGIGKGIALDAALAVLATAGIEGALLDFGGSSQAAIGTNGGRPWRVAVGGRTPGVIHGFVELAGRALSTSRTVAPGDAAGSIVDPSSGAAVVEPRLVTVLGPDATKAEAWSTALVVRGRAGLAAARAAGIEALLEDASGVVTTPGFPLHPLD